jgi:hypothetical protein
MAKSTKNTQIAATVKPTVAKAKVGKAATATVAKKVRASAAEVFAKKIAAVKSTGNPNLDIALRKIITNIRDGAAGIKADGTGFAGVVSKAQFQVNKVAAGKAARYVINIGMPGKGMEIGGRFAAIAFHQSARLLKPAAGAKVTSYDAAKVAELSKLLGL